jgi:hypothetical protein
MSAEPAVAAKRVAAAAAVIAVAVAAAAATTPADTAASGRSAAASPSVQSMIVGSGGAILSPSRTVLASSTSVRVAGRSCAVAPATPLAALAGARRAGGPGFALHDYGHCGSATRDSGQLFVYSLGGERNSGQSGWEYKVGHLAGATGAADPSGPLGDGRLLYSGERVLWFWCQAAHGGCERTLDAVPSSATVARGGSLSVTVTGFDNEGRGAPSAGSIVTLGSDFASTDASGRARLIVPSAPGRYTVSAAHAGLVPSFPETIVVR